ncbi:Uroporphyrinogen-III synthase HemD [Gracilaria domingensis]|nr:Uroporphyrinogen-III synthase HemD [Gracilaria domingensis]
MFAFATFSSAYSPRPRCTASLNPLEDRRVLVAAPKTYAARICPRLIERNARPIHAPLISNKSLPAAELFELEEAILRLSDYDLVTFISTVAIETFAQKLRAVCEMDDQALLMLRASGIRIATLATNGTFLKQILGVTPDILSPDPSPAGLADYLANDDSLRDAKVLCPMPKFVGLREPLSFSDFAERMNSTGFDFNSVAACKTVPIEREKVGLELKLLLSGDIDALLISNEAEASALGALLSDAERDALVSDVQSGRTMVVVPNADTEAAAQVLGFRKVSTSQDWISCQGVIHTLEEKFMEAHSGNGLLLPS